MKHGFLRIFPLLLALLVIAGCAQNTESPVPSPLPNTVLKTGWPADLVPDQLPEYTEGTVVNSGEDDGTCYIKIRDTDRDGLGKYLEKLQNTGWIVIGDSSEATAEYSLHTVDFQWQDRDTLLQMAVYTAEAGTWPFDEIPPDILQPRTGVLVGAVEILETGEHMWYFNYTYDDLDEAGAQAYLELLLENGWNGGHTMVSKSFEWNGKRYEATVEIYETMETRTTLTCNFYLSLEESSSKAPAAQAAGGMEHRLQTQPGEC